MCERHRLTRQDSMILEAAWTLVLYSVSVATTQKQSVEAFSVLQKQCQICDKPVPFDF